MSLKSFFYDRLLLIGILVTAALILWWLTDDIIAALVCLFSLIIISFIARLYQPWNEEKVIEELFKVIDLDLDKDVYTEYNTDMKIKYLLRQLLDVNLNEIILPL